jgi:hypothetical protein
VIRALIHQNVTPSNPESAFFQAALARDVLLQEAGQEFDFVIDGISYRGQNWRKGGDRQTIYFVYCPIGEWDEPRWVAEAN